MVLKDRGALFRLARQKVPILAMSEVTQAFQHGLHLLQVGQEETQDNRVVLSTIHRAKGLEWDAVFVVRCMAGHLPMPFWSNDPTWPLPHPPVDSPFLPAQQSVSICWPGLVSAMVRSSWADKPAHRWGAAFTIAVGIRNADLMGLEHVGRMPCPTWKRRPAPE